MNQRVLKIEFLERRDIVKVFTRVFKFQLFHRRERGYSLAAPAVAIVCTAGHGIQSYIVNHNATIPTTMIFGIVKQSTI